MTPILLRNPYPGVQRDAQRSYGGSQGWLSDAVAQKSGCGLVAAADLLIYLHRYGGYTAEFFRELPADPIPAEIYDYYAQRLRKRYFPLAASFGLNAFVLALGLDRFFRENGIPLRAAWGTPGRRFWGDIQSMLARDIPVILCVGINFPLPWGREQLALYTRQGGGEFRRTAAARAHYVTVTGMDEQWLRVSSWGGEYHIRREEYDRYKREHSCGLYSNILRLRRAPR